MFRDREEAGYRLSDRLSRESFVDPLVVGIVPGGVVIGAIVAWELEAEFEPLVTAKMRAACQPERVLGALAETGEEVLDEEAVALPHVTADYLVHEYRRQLAHASRRHRLFHDHPAASLTGREVILVDDGVSTGLTIRAALKSLRARRPGKIIVALPVVPSWRLADIGKLCDRLVCLESPSSFDSLKNCYERFAELTDEEVVERLRALEPDCVVS